MKICEAAKRLTEWLCESGFVENCTSSESEMLESHVQQAINEEVCHYVNKNKRLLEENAEQDAEIEMLKDTLKYIVIASTEENVVEAALIHLDDEEMVMDGDEIIRMLREVTESVQNRMADFEERIDSIEYRLRTLEAKSLKSEEE